MSGGSRPAPAGIRTLATGCRGAVAARESIPPELFLSGYADEIRELAERLRDVVREAVPEAIEPVGEIARRDRGTGVVETTDQPVFQDRGPGALGAIERSAGRP